MHPDLLIETLLAIRQQARSPEEAAAAVRAVLQALPAVLGEQQDIAGQASDRATSARRDAQPPGN